MASWLYAPIGWALSWVYTPAPEEKKKKKVIIIIPAGVTPGSDSYVDLVRKTFEQIPRFAFGKDKGKGETQFDKYEKFARVSQGTKLGAKTMCDPVSTPQVKKTTDDDLKSAMFMGMPPGKVDPKLQEFMKKRRAQLV